jgi:hypothetical protein
MSSKFLLQGGAFNVNSIDALAWAAVLRSIRFSPVAFAFLDADPATGTADDTAVQTLQSPDARFLRFAQSAQETFKADDGYVQSTSGTEEEVINTPLFRRGVRTLTASQLSTLARTIATAVRARLVAMGPFRSLEEFLKPLAPGGMSLLEQAIADAGLNVDVAEFSSQWLTQADIMTALAPVLFPRSDTFIVRAYGEAINPATGSTEGRAWCEATVQRVPEYFDHTQPAETALADLSETNKLYGRRFKVVSFRWLTRSDI